jgi:hypothetical protein
VIWSVRWRYARHPRMSSSVKTIYPVISRDGSSRFAPESAIYDRPTVLGMTLEVQGRTTSLLPAQNSACPQRVDWRRLQCAHHRAHTRSDDHHPAANANQGPIENGPKIIGFRPVLGFPIALANRHLRPLGHLTADVQVYETATLTRKRSMAKR